MAKWEKQPNRWVLTVMLALSVLMAMSGRGLARRVRGLSLPVLGPATDAGMYLATSFRGNFRDDAEERLALSERDAQMLAALARGELRELSPDDITRLQEIIDTQMTRLARHWKGQAHDAHTTIAQLTNFHRLFGPIEDLSCELIPARVVSADSLPYGQTRLVNAGLRNGASAGEQVTTRLLLTNRAKALAYSSRLSVVTGTALVGRLGETGAFTARLILVTDRSFRMEAQIDRVIDPDNPRMIQVERAGQVMTEPLSATNNAFIDCTAEGNGSDAVIVHSVSTAHNIKPGDWLVVRIVGAYYTTRIPIGQIVRRSDDARSGAGFHELRVEPMVDLSALREVYIINPILGVLEGGP